MDDRLRHGSRYLYPKDDPNSITLRLYSLTDDARRRIEVAFDTNASGSSGSSTGMLTSARSNQAYTTGASPALVAYQQSDYTYDLGGGNSTASHKWLQRLHTTWNYKDANNDCQSKLLVQNDYTYDNAGQRISNTISGLDANGNTTSRTEHYAYDEVSRLTSVDYGDGQTQSYAFDSIGNRASKTDAGGGMGGTEAYSYNAANMLLRRAGNPYISDANGNTLSGGGRVNTWDSQNRMVSCVNTNAAGVTTTSQLTYACDGLRHRSVTNGATTDFVLDASMFIREMSGGSVKATYFMGASGPAYRRDDTTGQVRWYLYDGLGSVLGEVDPSGNITAKRKYDVYGLSRSVTGTPSSKHGFVGSLGHPSEDETGLIYMRARYYDPVIGRFTNEDSARQGTNWFAYCSNNPINSIDADGRIATKVVASYLSKLLDLLSDAILALYEFVAMQGAGPALLGAIIAAAKAIHKGEMPSWTEIGMQVLGAIAMTGMSAMAGGITKWVNEATESIQTGQQIARAVRTIAFIHNMMWLVLMAEM